MERELILEKLLKKYENSKHLSEPDISKRRIMLNINKKDLPEYEYEVAEVRDRFNSATQALANEKIIEIEFLNDRPVISLIILNLQKINEAYKIADRVHPKKAAEKCITIIKDSLTDVKTPWIQTWRDITCETISRTLRLPSFQVKGDLFAKEFLNILSFYDRLNGVTITTRAFSSACLQNSKRFENDFQDEFLKVAENFHSEVIDLSFQENFGTREKLAVLGIVSHHELYQLSGCISFTTKRGEIDFSASFPHTVAISDSIVDEIETFYLEKIKKIIFIENLTNYNEYLRTEINSNELIIFHGGYLSPKKRQFIYKLSESIPSGIDVFFWGDIDLGGFQMFGNLQKIITKLRPMRMTADLIKKHKNSGLKRTHAYLELLEIASEQNRYPVFDESIKMILHYGVTIEQESLLQIN